MTGTGRVLTILSEFGDQDSGKLGRVPGPLHNQIAEPDRTVDNSTHWTADFNTDYYADLFFGSGDSFADIYTKMSSGAYTVDGEVSDWVQVPGNASTYGDNTVEDFGGAWQFIEDTGNAWYDAQIADNKTLAEDAIWSHRWFVNPTDFGLTGPNIDGDDGPVDVLFGGAEIGDTGLWLGDYTVEAENGGLGVFAHEFGHDLGLPDLYDTNGGENGTAFWTLMSLGSWLGDGTVDIGTKPDYLGPWEKLQLGWLDYQVVSPGESGEYVLSPAATQVTDQAQAVIVDVPDEAIETTYTAPNSGASAWWTGSADDLNTTLTRSLDLTGFKSVTVSAKAWYDIEAGYDYLYGEYSTDAGANWTQLGAPVDGTSKDKWTTVKYTVPGGGPVLFRFRYQTDGGVHLPGAFLDDIVIKSGGTTLFTDDVESGENGWTADGDGGFKISTGTESVVGDRYYIAEHRTYVDYDTTLEVGPYQFSFAFTAPNKVEHFPFQDGLLIWMVDETYSDNNTIDHPGHGLALPVDARPTPFFYSDGTKPSNRRQPFDATFGLQLPDDVVLHKEVLVGKGKAQHVETLEASPSTRVVIATFDDTDFDAYWSSLNPLGSTYVAGHGVEITVVDQNTGGTMTIEVTNPD